MLILSDKLKKKKTLNPNNTRPAFALNTLPASLFCIFDRTHCSAKIIIVIIKHSQMSIKLKLFAILVSIFLTGSLSAQEMANHEQELLILFEKLRFEDTDSKKDSLNALILSKFKKTLEEPASFDYPFGQLRSTGILKSSDELLKIYNWNLFYENGSNKYFGFVQYRKKKRKTHKLYELKDKSAGMQAPELLKLSAQNWYGCLYYNMVEKKVGRKTIYTLMGWDANDNFSNKKIIDILHIDKNNIYFGMPVLNYKNQTYHRLIFEYAEQAKMLLQYDKRYDMIIWDHLSAPNSDLKGKHEYYGPDGTQDGLNFKNDEWQYHPNIKPKNRQ
jgi:hypothetical protein